MQDVYKRQELYTAIPKVKTVFEDLNAILLNKLLKRNIDLIKYSPEQYLSLIHIYSFFYNVIGNASERLQANDMIDSLGSKG